MKTIQQYSWHQDGRLACPHARTEGAPCAARDGDTAVSIVGLCIGCQQSPADLLKDLAAAVATDNPGWARPDRLRHART